MHDDQIRLADELEGTELVGGEVFRLSIGSFGPHVLHVLRVRGREVLSRPYTWAVTFFSSEPSFVEDAVIGQSARLTIVPLAETPREIFGVVAEITACAGAEHGHRAYRARIVPQLARLKWRRTSRVFEGRSVPEIIGDVLDLAGVAHRFELRAAYAPRAYCVQYDETDLGFVQRLCAETGLWFRFDAPAKPDARGASEVVAFGDEGAAPEMDGGARLVLCPSRGSALRGEETHITSFEVGRAAVPAAIMVRGYDFRRPEAPLDAHSALGAGETARELTAVVYEHQDRDEDAKDAESGLAGAFLSQLTRGARTAKGTSLCPRLAPGLRFWVDGPRESDREASYVVTAIVHEGRTARLAGERPTYENRFSCVPGSLTPRPARPRRKARAVTETALVVGPAGSEIHTDEHGRVRVRFHWQTERGKCEQNACWARVAEPWAGASWGSQWIPRVGMEVLVSFLGGDASRPVVVGCLRNATHPAPFVLPRDRATSGIRTQSMPGGDGYNELSFHDAKGAELLGVRAERDLVAVVRRDAVGYVGQDQTLAVGNDRRATVARVDALDVGQELTVTVAGTARQEMSDQTIAHATGGGAGMTLAGGNASLETKGDINLRAGGNVTIDAAGNITIKAGGMVTIQAAGALSLVGATITAEAGGAIVVKGSTVDLNP